jgi:hypothetical protein
MIIWSFGQQQPRLKRCVHSRAPRWKALLLGMVLVLAGLDGEATTDGGITGSSSATTGSGVCCTGYRAT